MYHTTFEAPRRYYHKFRVSVERRTPMLSERWLFVAQQELGETTDRVNHELEQLKLLIAGIDLNYSGIQHDDFLLRFLRARKFKTKDAFKMLQRYCELKQRFPDSQSPSSLLPVFSQHLSCVLPDRDENGRGVFIFRLGKWDPSSCSLKDIFLANVACLELLVREPVTQVCGIVALVDLAEMGLRQVRPVTPSYAREVVSLLQDCFPLRFKAIHCVNEPRIFHLLYAMVKPFLTEKLTKRLYFHGRDLTSVHRYLPRDILPSDYGGDHASFSSNDTLVALQSIKYYSE